MIYRVKTLKDVALPKFALNDKNLKEVDMVKYLAHLFNDDLSDDVDIHHHHHHHHHHQYTGQRIGSCEDQKKK